MGRSAVGRSGTRNLASGTSPHARWRLALWALLWALVLALLLAHGLWFGSWIVDDAGISFAYARHLAAGHGLVAQPGVSAVEGYSNFLWILLLTPFFALEVFDPVGTPKLLAFLCLVGTFLVLRRGFRRTAPPGTPSGEPGALLVGLLLALNTSFVAWGVSGLENPLYALLAAVTWMLAAEALTETVTEKVTETSNGAPGKARRRVPGFGLAPGLASGLAAAAMAMTRPDGVVFAAGLPLAAGWIALAARRGSPSRKPLRPVLLHGASFSALFGAFLLFRRLYFGHWLPNTFTAKVGPGGAGDEGGPLGFFGLSRLLTSSGPRESPWAPFQGALGAAGPVVLGLLVVAVFWLARRRALRDVHRVWLTFAVLAALVFLVLPPDWMGEYRFATPFFVYFYGAVVTVGDAAIRELRKLAGPGALERRAPISPEHRLRWLPGVLALGLVVLATVSFFPRTSAFAGNPTVPLQDVRRGFAQRFERYADRLGVEDASILLPDVGAPLFYSELEVHDLAGLLDPQIARTLGRDLPRLHDYVFETLRPTFVHSHGHWTAVSRLELDPRFRRDYIPLLEYPDVQVDGRLLHSGDWLRRDVAEARPRVVAEIQQELGGPQSQWPRPRAGW